MSNALTKPERSEPLRQEQWTGRPHPHHAHPGPPEKDTGSRARRRPVSNPGPPTSDSHGANPGLPAAAGSGDQPGWEQEQGRNSCFLAALPEDEPSGSLDMTTRQPRTPRPWSRSPAAGHSKPSPEALDGPGEKARTSAKGLGAPTTSTPQETSPDHRLPLRLGRIRPPIPSPGTPAALDPSTCPFMGRRGAPALCEPLPLADQTHIETPPTSCPAGQKNGLSQPPRQMDRQEAAWSLHTPSPDQGSTMACPGPQAHVAPAFSRDTGHSDWGSDYSLSRANPQESLTNAH